MHSEQVYINATTAMDKRPNTPQHRVTKCAVKGRFHFLPARRDHLPGNTSIYTIYFIRRKWPVKNQPG
jgi:hypothetical protein